MAGNAKEHRPVLEEVDIEGLFGDTNLRLEFYDDITFFHGKNGVGKTTALKLIEAALQLDADALHAVPFDSVTIRFTDEATLRLATKSPVGDEPPQDSKTPPGKITADYEYTDQDRKQKKDTVALQATAMGRGRSRNEIVHGRGLVSDLQFSDLRRLQNLAPKEYHLRHRGGDLVVNLPTGETKTIREWLDFFAPEPDRDALAEKLRTRYGRVIFLGSDRLSQSGLRHFPEMREASKSIAESKGKRGGWGWDEEDQAQEPAVRLISEHARSEIERIQKDIGSSSSKLDGQFIEAVLKEESRPSRDVVKKVLEQCIDRMKSGHAYFGESDLPINLDVLDDGDVESSYRFLKVLAETLLTRYVARSDYADKVEMFEQLLKERFGEAKEVLLRPEGLQATRDEESIELEKLSSGEQHQILTLYLLILYADPGSVVLFDEPEISLHPAWQELFAETMQKIHAKLGHQIAVMTHAPDIIGDRRDRVRPVGPS